MNSLDFISWLIRKHKLERATDVWRHVTQDELDIYLRSHANPVIKKTNFHFPVSIAGGFKNLALEKCNFIEGLELKSATASENMSILNIKVYKKLLVWDILVGGTFRTNQSWTEMVPGRGKLSRIKTGALVFRGEVLHK